MADDATAGRPEAAEADDAAFRRPAGVFESFSHRDPQPTYTPPPPTVSPQERAHFARPAGAAEAFAPAPGERIAPTHTVPPPVYPELTAAFRRVGDGSFAPVPGTRIEPTLHETESPWWKPDAHRDPWRNPNSPFWLGRPAVFRAGQL